MLNASKSHIRSAGFLRVLIPLAVLTLYFSVMSWFLTWFMPGESANVSSAFIDRSWKLAASLTVGCYFLFLGLFRLAGGRELVYRNAIGWPSKADWFLILLPLTPVVQYIFNNLNILTLSGSLFLLGIFAVLAFLFVILVPAVLGGITPVRPMVFLGLALTFTMTNMASLSAARNWFELGHYGLQILVFGGVFLVGLICYNYVGRKFVYGVVLLYFVSNGFTQYLAVVQKKPAPVRTDTGSKLISQVGSRVPISKPNIYLLIYDAYVAQETMVGYGIDNKPQEQYLREQGFVLYPEVYSVAGFTVGTMSRVLNASMDFYGDTRSAVSGRSIVTNLLQSFGYKTHGIFWSDFFFRINGSGYDVSYPPPKAVHLLMAKAIFMGEFRFDIEYDNPPREKFEAHKKAVFGKPSTQPRFVYMHDNLPGHSQNSGKCRPEEIDRYADKLLLANQEMKRNLAEILQADPHALIIVAGDHGPYLTKNCHDTGNDYPLNEINRLDIQDRFGTFLAIKWPHGEVPVNDDITILQDVFPAVFAELFGDASLLDIRVEPTTTRPKCISGAVVRQGVIHGGINDGERLFLLSD